MRAHAIEPLHVVALRDRLRVGLKVSFRAHRPTHGYGQRAGGRTVQPNADIHVGSRPMREGVAVCSAGQ